MSSSNLSFICHFLHISDFNAENRVQYNTIQIKRNLLDKFSSNTYAFYVYFEVYMEQKDNKVEIRTNITRVEVIVSFFAILIELTGAILSPA